MGTGCLKLQPHQEPSENTIFTRSQPSRYGRSQLYRKNLLKNRNSHSNQSFFLEGSSGECISISSKTQEDLLSISRALNSHFIFSSISEEDKEVIANSMQLYSFTSGSTIFKQGMPSKSFYVIRSGSVDVLVDGHKVNKLQAGAGFGELALISSSNRSTTIRCAEASSFWVMQRETFKKLMEEMSTEAFEQNRMFLDRIHLLSSLNSAQKDLLAANMVSVKYKPGQHIIQEGDKGEVMFIIKEGTVVVTRKGQEINQLKGGSFFGEQALISNTTRNATCTAETVVYCVYLSREVIQQVLKYSLKEIIQRNYIVEALNKSLTLGLLKNSQKDAIVNDLTIVDYRSGDIVITKGDSCKRKLFVIISGRIQNSRNIHLFAEKGFCIGDEFIDDNNETCYEDDFIAGCDMQVGEITKYQLELTLGGKYEDIVRENSALAVLRKVWLFNFVDDKLLKTLIPKITVEKVKKYEVVLKSGKQSENVYIVKKGKIDYFSDGKVKKSVTKYGFFGESSLLKEKFTLGSFAAAEDSQLWVVSHLDFEPLVCEKMIAELNDRESQVNTSITLNHSIPIQLLGKGLYSKVYLMMSETGLYYALKTYDYSLIEKIHINQQILVLIT
jgi:cGMP-dependent protein kinase